jgi:hypothetical protein
VKRRVLPPINFKAYRKPIYLHVVYDDFGRGTARYGQSYSRESCPICQGTDERGRCFVWNFAACSFYCHKCKANGDALELVRRIWKCSVVEAAKWLEQRGGPAGSGLVVSTLVPNGMVETVP